MHDDSVSLHSAVHWPPPVNEQHLPIFKTLLTLTHRSLEPCIEGVESTARTPIRIQVDHALDTDAHGAHGHTPPGVSCRGAASTTPREQGAAAGSGGGGTATGTTGLGRSGESATRAPRVAILTATSPERVEFYHAATQSKQCYAARHGCVSAYSQTEHSQGYRTALATLLPATRERQN